MKNDQVKLSIIIPVYNVEAYLNECVDSIINFDMNFVEIILVDDGSTDNSGSICDEYSNKFDFITTIHQANKGLSGARNTGIINAHGKYLTFVDSDDKINGSSLEKIIDYVSINDTDLIFLNMSKFYKNGDIEDIGEYIDKKMLINNNKKNCIRYLSSRPKFPASACAKLYLKKYLEENDIYFPSDRRVSEDMGFSFKCILYATTFDKIDVPFYYYRQNRENSITNNITFKSFKGLSQFIIDSLNLYADGGYPINSNIKNMFNFLSYEYSILLWHYNFLNKDDRVFALQFLKEYKYVMKWSLTRNNRIIKYLLKIFGIRITSKILFFMKRVK